MLMVRHTQREILYNALRRFERGLLHRNLKAEKNALTGKGSKHVSIMPSSPTAPASVIGRGESGCARAACMLCTCLFVKSLALTASCHPQHVSQYMVQEHMWLDL